jgi:hypothetical protein
MRHFARTAATHSREKSNSAMCVNIFPILLTLFPTRITEKKKQRWGGVSKSYWHVTAVAVL